MRLDAHSKISIHAPIVGCDNMYLINSSRYTKFQSTHPSWGATQNATTSSVKVIDFNPRTHRGVRQVFQKNRGLSQDDFNPRTHRGVRRYRRKWTLLTQRNFNPRTHRGVRRKRLLSEERQKQISIHAPIVGCDVVLHCYIDTMKHYFNPRTHRGVRHTQYLESLKQRGISIHAPIVGCDFII